MHVFSATFFSCNTCLVYTSSFKNWQSPKCFSQPPYSCTVLYTKKPSWIIRLLTFFLSLPYIEAFTNCTFHSHRNYKSALGWCFNRCEPLLLFPYLTHARCLTYNEPSFSLSFGSFNTTREGLLWLKFEFELDTSFS